MIDERDVCTIGLEMRGFEPPHEFELKVGGFIRDRIDDRVIKIVHDHGAEMAPYIVEAINRVVLARLEKY